MQSLMILGAGINQLPIIKKTKEMDNVTTTVIDRDPYAVGVKYANGFKNISIAENDHNVLTSLACFFGIDGVIAPCADAGLFMMGRLNSLFRLKGPSLASVYLSQNKKAFGSIVSGCLSGVKTPEIYEDFYESNFPYIVKPVDGVGSKGVYKVTGFSQKLSPNELLERARSHSTSKEAIIQQYIPGIVFNIDLLMQEGEVKYWILHDEIFEKDKNNFGVDMFVFPSVYHSSMFEYSILCSCMDVLNLLGLSDGNIAIEGTVYDKQVYIFEVNPRMSGSCHMETHTLASGIDWIEDGINVVLGNHVDKKYCDPVPHAWAMIGSQKAGKIKSINVLEGLTHWLLKDVGEYVEEFNGIDTSTEQSIVVIYVEGESREHVIGQVNYYKRQVHIEVE